MNRAQRYSLTGLTLSVLALPAVAFGQVPSDPPTSRNPPPNVMMVFDATRTTLIDTNTCGTSDCHIQASNCSSPGDKDSCDIVRRGRTRYQLAKELMTGGWGWNTSFRWRGQTADARLATTGIMDLYKVRWGVMYYDGVGTRLVRDPSLDNLATQKAVIDFGHASNESLGAGVGAGAPRLASLGRARGAGGAFGAGAGPGC